MATMQTNQNKNIRKIQSRGTTQNQTNRIQIIKKNTKRRHQQKIERDNLCTENKNNNKQNLQIQIKLDDNSDYEEEAQHQTNTS